MGSPGDLFGNPRPLARPSAKAAGKRYLAFDLETAKPTPKYAPDIKRYRPLGISCAAVYDGEGEPTVWCNGSDGKITGGQLSTQSAREIVRQLQGYVANGYQIVSWNGVGFDFDILAEESGLLAECRDLALNHVDMLFHIFCLKGFAIALAKAAAGCRVKAPGGQLDGAEVPQAWARGQHGQVIEHITGDVVATWELAQVVDRSRRLGWVTARGRESIIEIGRWLPVSEAAKLPLPDTSWMKDPWTRSKFIGWIDIQHAS